MSTTHTIMASAVKQVTALEQQRDGLVLERDAWRKRALAAEARLATLRALVATADLGDAPEPEPAA